MCARFALALVSMAECAGLSPTLGEWWIYAAICLTFGAHLHFRSLNIRAVCAVVVSGLMSGLTVRDKRKKSTQSIEFLQVGLMSISALEVVSATLRRKHLLSAYSQSVLQNDEDGDPEAKKAAAVRKA